MCRTRSRVRGWRSRRWVPVHWRRTSHLHLRLHLWIRLGRYLRVSLWRHLRVHPGLHSQIRLRWYVRTSWRQMTDIGTGTCKSGDGERSSMNQSNHLSHWILKLSEDGNGMTEMRDWTLGGRGKIQWSAVHVKGMKKWLSRTLTSGGRDSL